MANGNMEAAQKNYDKVVAKAWSDEEFKRTLIADPESVLKENGVEVPEGMEIKVVENTDKLVHVTLPPKPKEGELSDQDLQNVTGVAKAWFDEEFKRKLMADPKSVLKENGVEVPEGIEIKVVENTNKLVHITLAQFVEEGELSDQDLQNVAGGVNLFRVIRYMLAKTWMKLDRWYSKNCNKWWMPL
jgi:hypothetical protein